MSNKLTLSISDKELIEEAKKNAKERNQSLSRMIENYLKAFVSRERRREIKELEISPQVKSLMGIMKRDDNFDYKKERDKMYDEKYKKYLSNNTI